jgi:bacteriochlorophyllide a dehydrogenase
MAVSAKAIVFREANIPLLEEVRLPDPTADQVVVRINYSGVSIGTESSIFSGKRTHNGTFPLVGGYMASGTVEAIGAEVTSYKPGDKVISPGSAIDGEITSIWGGHMSHHVIAANAILPVPDGVAMREAAMFILPAVGLNAVTMSGITEHDTVLIQGQGLIGQFFGQFARARGATVITVEPDASRANLSKQYVTPHALTPTDDVSAAIDEITNGKGATIVVEATGNKSLIKLATCHLRPHGKMVFLGWYPEEIAIDYHHFHANSVTAYFPMGAGDADTFRAVLDSLARGTLIMGDNLTDELPLDKVFEGYKRIVNGDRSIMGMVVNWRNT